MRVHGSLNVKGASGIKCIRTHVEELVFIVEGKRTI